MNRTALAALLAAAALALTGCQEYTPDATTAQVACERLVAQDLQAPDDATFQHLTTTQEDNHWTVVGVVTVHDDEGRHGGTRPSADQYRCQVEFHDGANFTGTVSYATP